MSGSRGTANPSSVSAAGRGGREKARAGTT